MSSIRIIGGEHKGRPVQTMPDTGDGYRPATGRVREALFNMLAARGVHFPSVRVLDVFAGSGSLSLEALSRGATYALLLEQDKKAAAIIRKNLAAFGYGSDRASVAVSDAMTTLTKRCASPFDLVFVDPPYGRDMLAPAMTKVLANGWLAAGGVLAAEVEARAEVQYDWDGLEMDTEKTYGQTRIVLWNAPPA